MNLLVGDVQVGLAGFVDEIDQRNDGLAHDELSVFISRDALQRWTVRISSTVFKGLATK